MRSKLMVLVSVSMLVTGTAFATPEHMHELKPGSPEFEQLKTLAGTWKGTSKMEGGEEKEATIEYKVTSGGSAVVETLFPGTAEEMISVYHDDANGKLSMTHYCALGNQPQLDLKKAEGGHYVLSLSPSSSLSSETAHMDALDLNLKGDELIQTWTCHQPGKPDGATTISVKRV